MSVSSAGLLILAVALVGVLHTAVPDHWAPIVLLSRQHRWSVAKTARTAAIAGLGHVTSTLAIAIVVWLAGAALATRFAHLASLLSSIALIVFGAWIAISSWREMREHHGEHGAGHEHANVAVSEVSSRTALLLILGSSPMIEGIPAFFAASRYGPALLAIMAVVFAVSTIATYVVMCAAGASGMQRVQLGRFEEYGEIISGSFIALLGIVFAFFPAL